MPMSKQGVGLLSNLAEVEEEAREIQEGVAVHRRNAEHAATRYLIADDATQDDSLGLRGTSNTARDANMSRLIVGLPYRFRRSLIRRELGKADMPSKHASSHY